MMSQVICPTVTAFSTDEYTAEIERIRSFVRRVHIDLMDGEFAPTVSPDLSTVWWPDSMEADIHLMYMRPMEYLEQLVKLKPRMVVIHFEADVHHMHFAAELHKAGILAGLALLRDTTVESATDVIHSFDHVLVFSGKLGYHGGAADLGLLSKVRAVHECHPSAEIGWDGGINAENAGSLTNGGVDVLNVGGYIQNATDPSNAYATLKTVIES
jgi:ribulose-phosphate 3-epimerase